jgi:hypothetical protein
MFDAARYNRLLAKAIWNQEFFRDHFQDLGRNKTIMSTVGTPYFIKSAGVNSLICGNGSYTYNALFRPIVTDISVPIAAEYLFFANSNSSDYIWNQAAPPGGGFNIAFAMAATNYTYVHGIPAGGGNGRYLVTPTNSIQYRKLHHVIIVATNTFMNGTGWINGIPVTVSLTNLGVPAVTSTGQIRTGSYGMLSNQGVFFIRIWQGIALTNDDAQCLYSAARSLVGNEI